MACVLLLCLGQRDFPVDTNVGRISARLGWIPLDAEQALEVCWRSSKLWLVSQVHVAGMPCSLAARAEIHMHGMAITLCACFSAVALSGSACL